MTVKNPREHLLFAFRRVLRPLIRILVRAGVRYDEFSALVRGVYVEAAAADGVGSVTKPTRARISVATGVGRTEVDRYIDNDGALPFIEQSFAMTLARILNTWHTDAQFVGPYGIPLELARHGTKGRTFQELVHAVDSGADSSAAFQELLRLGAVTMSGETHVRVVSRAMIATEEWSPAQLELFGNSLTRLADTLQFNLDARNSTKRIERTVVAHKGLPPSVIPKFEAHLREKVSELLVDLDDWITPHTESSGPKTPIIGLSVFEFSDPDSDYSKGSLRNSVAEDTGAKP
jgi:hypothetical protein